MRTTVHIEKNDKVDYEKTTHASNSGRHQEADRHKGFFYSDTSLIHLFRRYGTVLRKIK